jgi:hypothetical protein
VLEGAGTNLRFSELVGDDLETLLLLSQGKTDHALGPSGGTPNAG